PGLTVEAVEEKTLRLNEAAVDAGRHTCGRDVVSLSVGTAFCPEDGYDVEALLAEADRRMYSMKQTHHAKRSAGKDSIARGASGE
ncbi:MAG: diguanylate cyclase, partial [Candidatus Sulfotelmatobacter sp.]